MSPKKNVFEEKIEMFEKKKGNGKLSRRRNKKNCRQQRQNAKRGGPLDRPQVEALRWQTADEAHLTAAKIHSSPREFICRCEYIIMLRCESAVVATSMHIRICTPLFSGVLRESFVESTRGKKTVEQPSEFTKFRRALVLSYIECSRSLRV